MKAATASYGLVVGHETRTLVRAPAFAAVLALLVAAMAFAVWAGGWSLAWREQGRVAMVDAIAAQRAKLQQDVAAYERRMAEEGREMEIAVYSHAPRGPIPPGTNAGTIGGTTHAPAVLPPTGLAAFAIGQSDLQPSYLRVSGDSIVAITQRTELGNPVNLKRGPFDIAFVVIFLLPIFILAISYDMLSSEHERGTLAMVLSHPLSLRRLMASKAISRAAIIVAVVLICGLTALLTVGGNLAEAETWLRFALWLAATLLYAAFWFALAVLVNALSRDSATNGVILAGAWLLLVVIVPTLVSVGATSAFPAPSRFDFITASRSEQTVTERNYMAALDRYYYDHVEFAPEGEVNDFLAVTMAKKQAVDEAMAPLYARFRSQLAAQDRAVAQLQYLSPAIMMQRVLNEAAGTSSARYEDFFEQVGTFRERWVEYFTRRFLNEIPLRAADYPDFPAFVYEHEPVSAMLARSAGAVAGIGLVTLAVWLAALAGLRRYQVAAR
jgi:ABC-2 type transport system permease protein